MAVYPYDAGLADKFVYKNRFGDEVSMAVREGLRLLVPRACVPVGKVDKRLLKPPIPAINCKSPPRNEEQRTLIAQSITHLKAGKDHIFEAPTGFGKTYCGLSIATALRQPTLIVVTKDDLVKQWRDTMIHAIGIPPERIGHVQQDQCSFKDKWFVLTMVHSIILPNRYPAELFEHFGMVLFDEVHRMGAETFEQACRLFPARHRLGMSATPERADGKDQSIQAHLGPVLVVGKTVPMSPKVIVKPTGWVIPPTWGWEETLDDKGVVVEREWVFKLHEPNRARMMSVFIEMAKSKKRNTLLCEFVASAYRKGRTTVIMSHLVEGHLDLLFHRVAEYVPAQDIAYYHGTAKAAELQRAKTTARVVLATYKMTSEGTDVPHWDALVLATPLARVQQAIGRVLRSMDGKPTPIVFDPVDRDPLFDQFFRCRERDYFKVHSTIVRM